jgi:hypothetical protein
MCRIPPPPQIIPYWNTVESMQSIPYARYQYSECELSFLSYGVWLSYPERKLYSFGLSYRSAVYIYYATRVCEHAVTETHWWLCAAWISICRGNYATLLSTRDRSCNWMKHAQNHGQYHLVRDARCYPTLPADGRYCLNHFAWSSATTRNNLIIETSYRWACDVSKWHPIRDDVSYWSGPIGTGFLITSTNNMFYSKSEMFRIIQVFNGS